MSSAPRDVRMKGFAARTRVADAQALLVERLARLGAERVPITRALGRVPAAPVLAPEDVPPHPKSAMDGYAVRAADLPGALRVVAEQMADDLGARRVLGPGEATRVMTGARVVDGADAVVMVEHTRLDGDRVIIERAEPAGRNVLATGEDVARGAPVLGVGRALRGPDLALAATLGLTELDVVRRPRVRIVPTGDELVPIGRVRRGAEVIETNALMLGALAARDGAEVDVYPIVRDDEAALERAIREGEADVVVVTGGSSVGKRDLGPVVVARVGALPVHGIHARPASPTGVGFVDGRLVLLVPGFPVASYVAWDLLGRVAAQRLLGLAPRWPYARVSATLAAPLEKPAERVDVVRVTLEGDAAPTARPIPGGAALISTLTRADGFVLVPEGVERWPAGTSVEVRTYEP